MNMETTTTTTHTPGPWIYTEGLGGTKSHVHFYIGPDVRDAQGPETISPSVAGAESNSWIHAGNPNVLIPVAVAEANARLIAAAPDLLEQLEEARQYVAKVSADHDGTTVGRLAGRRLDRMNAAIAKATGGAE